MRWLIRIGVLFVLFTAIYAWQVEPFRIEVTAQDVPLGLKKPLRMMVLADLHTREFGRLERGILLAVASTKPDLIVIVGDCFTRGDHASSKKLLSSLRAPLGVWAVRGNWERWNPVPDEKKFFKRTGTRLLVNSNALVREDVALVGFDDPWTGVPSVDMAEKGLRLEPVRVALFHSPVFFEHVAGRYPLCLAGHTHGGQVRLPLIGPLWLPGSCGDYVSGWYTQNGSRLFVTRGLGTSILPIRFLCRPEIAILTLK